MMARARAWLHTSTTSLTAWPIPSLRSALYANGTVMPMMIAMIATTIMISMRVKASFGAIRCLFLADESKLYDQFSSIALLDSLRDRGLLMKGNRVERFINERCWR